MEAILALQTLDTQVENEVALDASDWSVCCLGSDESHANCCNTKTTI